MILPLAHLFQSTPNIRQQLPLQVDSFVKLALLCRLLSRAKFGTLQPVDLDEAVEKHGEAFLRTYEGLCVALKFHNARKLARQLRRDKFLMDCFPCERKHSLLKEAAEPVKNTSTFERTVLARALNLHKASLKHDMFDHLVRPSQDTSLASDCGVHDLEVGLELRMDGTIFGQGDVVFDSDTVAMFIVAPCNIQESVSDDHVLSFLGYRLEFVETVIAPPAWVMVMITHKKKC